MRRRRATRSCCPVELIGDVRVAAGAANPIAVAGIPQTLVALMTEPVFTQDSSSSRQPVPHGQVLGRVVDAVVGIFGGNTGG
jgi:hypothetical protein